MKLTDESWISYQKGKGNEEYQKYKDKPERGADLGVRTVQYKHNESEVTDDNVASGFFVLNDSASNFYVTNETTYDIIKTYKRK